MSEQAVEEEKQSRAGSNAGSDIEEEDAKPAPYIPKNPMIRPADVKISEIMQNLMKNDKDQENLHRVLGSAADLDNENTVADHMQKVFEVLIDSYPHCALQKLEEVSYLIRKGHDLSRFLTIGGLNRDYRSQAKDLGDYIDKTKPLFTKPAAGEDEEEAPPETAPTCGIQDLLAEERLFSCAGISFGQQESYLLQKSLQKLATDQSASFMRFFGKIRCTKADYYVVEATAEGGEEAGNEEEGEAAAEEKDPDQEEKGTGVNKYTYFVTNSPFSPWKRLPDLAPSHIEAARRIKVLFSGDLERDIICNPFFFGKEKNLLRAQIARITHSTVLVPAGSYRLNEESEREIDEFVPEEDSKVEPLPSTTQAANSNAWVHFNPSILNNCRTMHLDPPEDNGEEGYDPEEAKKAIERADPFEPRLKSICGDSKIKMGRNAMQSSWVVRLVGDKTEYLTEAGKVVCHGVVVVRSLTWPGSFTLYQNGRQTTIYVGDGAKFTDKLRPFPLSPPVLNEDPSEFGEFVLPEIKEVSPEELQAQIEAAFEESWGGIDSEGAGNLGVDDVKKIAAEIKAKMSGQEEAEINEEAFDQAFADVEKNDEGNADKQACKTFFVANMAKL